MFSARQTSKQYKQLAVIVNTCNHMWFFALLNTNGQNKIHHSLYTYCTLNNFQKWMKNNNKNHWKKIICRALCQCADDPNLNGEASRFNIETHSHVTVTIAVSDNKGHPSTN